MESQMAVFADDPQDPNSNLVLLKRVTAPAGQYALAVKKAVEAEDSIAVPKQSDGQEFMVMYDVNEPMEFSTYEWSGREVEA